MNRATLRFLAALGFALLLQTGAPAFADYWAGYTTLSAANGTFTSDTAMSYSPDYLCPPGFGNVCSWYLDGQHRIDTGFVMPIDIAGLYRGTLQAPGDPYTCAHASSNATAVVGIGMEFLSISADGWVSGQACMPPGMPNCTLSVGASGGGSISPNPSGTYPCFTSFSLTAVPAYDYVFHAWEGDITSSNPSISFVLDHDMALIADFEPAPPDPPDPPISDDCSADWVSGCSPIVINFAKGGYDLTGAESPVSFDIAATGTPIRIGWTAAGANEAFLCWDRDHDGRIASGAELFGTATPLKNGHAAGNGFVALAEYDDNHDGVMNDRDPVWWQLQLWRDLNHDGVSQPTELTPVAGSSLVAISLDDHWTGKRDTSGNLFKYQSRVWIAGEGPRPVYDIFFIRVP